MRFTAEFRKTVRQVTLNNAHVDFLIDSARIREHRGDVAGSDGGRDPWRDKLPNRRMIRVSTGLSARTPPVA